MKQFTYVSSEPSFSYRGQHLSQLHVNVWPGVKVEIWTERGESVILQWSTFLMMLTDLFNSTRGGLAWKEGE